MVAKPPTPIIPSPIITVGDHQVEPTGLGPTPPALPARANYLNGIREDNLLDGLIGNAVGRTGGGWSNPSTGLGTFGRDKVMQGHFQEPYRIVDPELSSLYNGNDIAKRIVDTVPREMFRRGWVLVIPQEGEESDEPTEPGEESEQPRGGESGPAAPGAPLVDPMGVGSDNARPAPAAKGAAYSDPMGEDLAKGIPANVTAPMKATGNPKPAAGRGMPPMDQSKGADMAMAVEGYAARLGLKPRVLESLIFGRLFGGGLLILGADDGQDMASPLNEENISTVRYLTWIDRRFIFASTWYAEIGPKYGEVETWEIINPFGGQANTRVHETRVIRFDGAPVDFLLRRRLLGWTLSVLQAPYDTMRQFDQSFQSISNLMADLSQAVMKINGLAQLISNDQKTLQTRMQMVDISRSSARMLYLDAENEEFERTATPLTGVADTLEMQMLRLAAAAEMPVAILFGREPSGLNATGDADFRRFYDVTAGKQREDLEPKLRRIYNVICLAKDSPCKGKLPTNGLKFVWHKLYEPSEKEQAEIRWLMAQADDKYVTNKVLLPEEVALSRFRDGELHLDTEIETELRDEALAEAELPPSGAEQAQQEQQNKQAEMQIKATAVQQKAPPPGARGDAFETARFDSETDDVYNLMSEDFPDEAIQWVHSAPWRGPTSIPCDQIDFSNQKKWQASKPEDAPKVEKFAEEIKNGAGVKPIVLVQTPKGKAIIVDGHHRALATHMAGKTAIKAYVAKVNKTKGPWDVTHDAQRHGKSG